MPAGKVRGVPQPPGVGVEGAGCSDDEPVDVVAGQPRRFDRAVEGVGDLAYDGLGGAPAGSGQLVLAHRPSGHVRDGGEDALGGDVQARRVGRARIDHVQLGVGARAPLAGPGGEYQTGRFEAGQEL